VSKLIIKLEHMQSYCYTYYGSRLFGKLIELEEKSMKFTNIDYVMKMVKDYLDGIIDSVT